MELYIEALNTKITHILVVCIVLEEGDKVEQVLQVDKVEPKLVVIATNLGKFVDINSICSTLVNNF